MQQHTHKHIHVSYVHCAHTQCTFAQQHTRTNERFSHFFLFSFSARFLDAHSTFRLPSSTLTLTFASNEHKPSSEREGARERQKFYFQDFQPNILSKYIAIAWVKWTLYLYVCNDVDITLYTQYFDRCDIEVVYVCVSIFTPKLRLNNGGGDSCKFTKEGTCIYCTTQAQTKSSIHVLLQVSPTNREIPNGNKTERKSERVLNWIDIQKSSLCDQHGFRFPILSTINFARILLFYKMHAHNACMHMFIVYN